MKIYWGWNDVPEFAGLPRKERRRVVRDCFLRFGFGIWQFWVGMLAMYTLGFLGGICGAVLRYGFGFSEIVHYVCASIGVLVGVLIFSLVYYTVVIERLRPHFRDYIAQRKTHA